MPACSYHPGVETNVRCVECDKPICPKDFVPTPVGYKCPDCARPLPGARRALKPRQLLLSVLAAAVVGIGGAFLLRMLGFSFWLPSALLGMLTAEAARRGSGGHRTPWVATAAVVSVIVGTGITGFGLIGMAVSAVVAWFSVMTNRW